MAYDFKFPDVGEGITEGEIVRWKVKEGDKVKEHDILAEVETDKAIVEIPSPKAGTILKIYHKEGDTIKVGETLVSIGEAGEKVPIPQAIKEEKVKPKKFYGVVGELEEAPTEAVQIKPSIEVSKKELAHVLATPAVRRLARDLGVDISQVTGTGLDGRVTEEDVRKFAESKGKTVEEPQLKVIRKYDIYGYVEHIPLKGVRKTISRKIKEAFDRVAPVTSMDEADVTELSKIRDKEKEKALQKGIHLTFLPFVIKALIAAMKLHPIVNATIDEEHEEIIIKKYYNFGIAIDTPDGLIVPVIKIADSKTILELAKEMQELSEKARKRTLDLADLQGNTFTITNYGSIGGSYGTPIINPPDVAILGMGRIEEKPVVRDGKIVIRKILPLSLTFDHRVFDGAEAARFLNDLKAFLEDPEMLLMEEK